MVMPGAGAQRQGDCWGSRRGWGSETRDGNEDGAWGEVDRETIPQRGVGVDEAVAGVWHVQMSKKV